MTEEDAPIHVLNSDAMAREKKAPRYIKKPRFGQWLFFQRERNDDIGDLARFAFADRIGDAMCWPMIASTVATINMHLRHEHARDAKAPTESMVHDAFEEFRQFLRTGGKVPARPGGVPKNESPFRHRSYFLPLAIIDQIKELADAEGITQGAVIEKVIGREHRRVFANK